MVLKCFLNKNSAFPRSFLPKFSTQSTIIITSKSMLMLFFVAGAWKTYHHLLKEVNDLFFREVHGAVVKKGLRYRQFGLGGERICWVLNKRLFLLHPRFPKTGDTIALKENSVWDVKPFCTINSPVYTRSSINVCVLGYLISLKGLSVFFLIAFKLTFIYFHLMHSETL